MHNPIRYLLFLLVGSAICLQAGAQQLPDSVIAQYNAAKTKEEKNISLFNYINYSPGDTVFFARAAAVINYLKSIKDQESQDYVQMFVNDQLATTGDYITALSSSLEILDHFERKLDTIGIMYTYQSLGRSYYYAGDKEKSIEYSKKAAIIAKKKNKISVLFLIMNNISTTYSQDSKGDSALTYALRAVEYSKQLHVPDMYVVHGTLGEAYISLKKYDLALPLLWQSLDAVKKGDDLTTAWIYNDLSQVYLETNRQDSAKYYAHLAIRMSQARGFKDQIQRAYGYLSRSFEKNSQADSAFKYLQLAVKVKDALYNEEKTKQLQGISSREQLRQQELEKAALELKNKMKIYGLVAGLTILCIAAFLLYRNNGQKQKANIILEGTLSKLRSTQSQLIQSEKMASLGELTAGIAHEIQNPLNFVNNFSEVNGELIEELESERSKVRSERDDVLEGEIINDIKQNLAKINHHGKRADAIVKGMLQHSKTSTGVKEPTDINKLADEYLRLAYHGMRAKDKDFNVDFKTDFDNSIGKINVVQQDLGRVLLNLFNNAFYAVNEKQRTAGETYQPTVFANTKKFDHTIEVAVKDNGNGIAQNITDKIFQPFFTTKPTGQGTGLGLSLAYDIIKAHGGKIKIETKEGEGSEFIIQLPS